MAGRALCEFCSYEGLGKFWRKRFESGSVFVGHEHLTRSYVVGDVQSPRVCGGLVGFRGCDSVYPRLIGMGSLMSSKARRWMVVGMGRVGMTGTVSSMP